MAGSGNVMKIDIVTCSVCGGRSSYDTDNVSSELFNRGKYRVPKPGEHELIALVGAAPVWEYGCGHCGSQVQHK